jgi:acyl dehydratase
MSDKPKTAELVMAASDSFKVGQHVSSTELIDDKMVRGYADLTGDHNPIHVNDAFAKRTKFGQRIAHGGILFGLASKVLGEKMPGLGTIYMSQLVNFHAPVFINDTVTCVATITALLPKHVAKISTVVTKQDGTIVMDGVSTVKLPGSLMKDVAPAPAPAKAA